MEKFKTQLANAESLIAGLRLIVDKTPEFARWEISPSSLDCSLIQFFPNDSNYESFPLVERERSALRVARAFGGEWTKVPQSGGNGQWRGAVTVAGQKLTVFLHHVFDSGIADLSVDLKVAETPIA
jgi:hypothetical protein